MTFIMMMMSPIVVPSLRLKKIANTSVPSITAPPLTDRPMPAPRKNHQILLPANYLLSHQEMLLWQQPGQGLK